MPWLFYVWKFPTFEYLHPFYPTLPSASNNHQSLLLAIFHKWKHTVFIFLSDFSQSNALKSIHVVANDKITFYGSVIFQHMFHIFFIHPPKDTWVVPMENHALEDTELHVSFQIKIFISFKYISRSDIYFDHTVFLVFLRNLNTILHSGYTNLHSHQQFSPHQTCLIFISRRINIA